MKAFVIILQESEHSRTVGKDTIDAANKFGVYPEVHNGVLGYNSPELFRKYGITRFLTYDLIDNPGHQGCFLSHFEVWMKCAKLNEPVIVLEHDGVFIRELPEDILDRFDGVLKLDPFDVYAGIEKYNQKVQASLSEPVDVWHQPARSTWHGVGDFIWGGYGYIIKPHAAIALIEFARTIGAAPTDVHIGRNIVDIKSTTVPVVKMHKFYDEENIRGSSSTSKLGKFVSGKNGLEGAEYLSPKKYKRLLDTLQFLETTE
jgi:GR25 family glycosyltransferase involved in LPS biosynthesis